MMFEGLATQPSQKALASRFAGLGVNSVIVALLTLVPLTQTGSLSEVVKRVSITAPPPLPAAPAAGEVLTKSSSHQALPTKIAPLPTLAQKRTSTVELIYDPAPEIGPGPLGEAPRIGGFPGAIPGAVFGGTTPVVPKFEEKVVEARERRQEPTAPKIIRIGGEVIAAKILRRVDPTYPPLAKAIRAEGEVVFQAIIDPQGNIAALRVTNSAHPFLIDEAKRAVSQWKYQPTLLNQEPVAVETTIRVHFKLSR